MNVADLPDPTLFYLLAVLGVLLAGFSKASAAGGVGLMAVPLMSIAIAPQYAAAIMLPILCALDLLGLWAYRKQYDPSMLWQLVPGAIIGIVVAALVFKTVDVRWVKGLLGLECLVFAVHRMLGARRAEAAAGRPPNRAKATFWSAVSGFTSTLAHAGGPPILQYLLPLKLPKALLVATTVYYFTIVNYIKLVPYAWLGLLERANLSTSLLLAPVIPIGYWIG
ncbi:MAG TPA: sulfite exporter TauE/SafE family protein, partial [Lautropia sp.]|nr:sulfite exporter TauE/SafE family protein [Lautropia sp.]